MRKTIAAASMSLDGYISGPAESGFGHLFAWYGNGGVEVPTARPDMTFHMTPQNAQLWNEVTAGLGALVTGRKTFDITGGWGGLHPIGVPVVVVTHQPPADWPHPDAPFTFVTGGVEAAIAAAREIAGDKDVSVAAGSIASQALSAGLLDEIWVMLAPVVLGAGTPFFQQLTDAPFTLAGPEVTTAPGATHLRYQVQPR